MNRRTFLLASASASLVACGRSGWLETTPAVGYPGMREGHALRDRATLPPPSAVHTVDVAILGAGAAGLSCAWQLARAGHRDFMVLSGPEYGGNSAGGTFGDLGYPKGAHYLPLPSKESTHLRDMLSDLGIIESGAFTDRPTFDERVLIHALDERLYLNGRWQDGLAPATCRARSRSTSICSSTITRRRGKAASTSRRSSAATRFRSRMPIATSSAFSRLAISRRFVCIRTPRPDAPPSPIK